MHNNLRITRILKSIGELGFEHYQAPLVRFFLEETLVKKTLSTVKRSVLDYFLFAVLDKQKRQDLVRFAYIHFEPKDKFVWCPRKIQRQFRKPEKRIDVVGNGEGKDEFCSQGKGKDGEAVMQQKQDGLDENTKTEKETDRAASKEKNLLSEASSEPKSDAEIVGNGNAKPGSHNDILGNGNDSAEDDDGMDQSPSSDTSLTKTESSADSQQKLTSDSKDVMQEPDNSMQTDEDIDNEKPPKKKKEEMVLPTNGSIGDSASGQVEEKACANTSTGQTSLPAQTSVQSLTHSSVKGEKIPRTEFDQMADDEEEELDAFQESVSATNGSLTSTGKCVDEQTNGKESEDIIMKSNPPSAEQNVGNS